jgi:O-methyltransferase involved in polyketide biosynthesis
VAEGVLMYLPAAAVAGFFEAAHGLCGPSSRLVFTYMICDEKGRPRVGNAAWLTRTSMKLMGHAWQWCVADEDALARFVAERGWRYEPDPERFDLAARYLVPLGRDDREHAAPLEFMAVVERGS